MLTLGALSFLNPWILAGLLTLPVLWWLLRAVPPSPRTQSFAGVRLLLGLEDEERQTDRTPWWLLLLRCVAIAAALLGLSQPVANLDQRLTGSGTLLLVLDQGWASAPDWTDRLTLARTVVDEADQAGRRIVIASGADATVSPVLDAEAARAMIGALEPRPWPVDRASLTEAIAALSDAPSETVWIHDGLDTEGADEMLALLGGLGPMRLVGPEQTVNAIAKPYLDQGQLKARVLRAAIGDESVQVIAMAESPEGGERRIAVADAIFDGAADAAEVSFNLPPELQGTVTRVMLSDRPTAGGSAMADGAIRRVIAGLVGIAGEKAVTSLISPTHYVEKALVPWADLVRGGMDEVLSREPATMILIDAGAIPDTEQQPLADWVEAGGLLIRFAGPRLAASIGAQGFGSAQADDPFLPVRLRRGGRVLGGALAWTTPRTLGPFDQSGPFRGLTPPAEVDVRTQVLAEPSPDLAGKVWASLDDGTPLVTAKRMGDGHIVLFHVSSDAEWSSLPLSGLFVEMLGRLMTMAPGSNAGVADAEAMADTLWRPELLMNVDGVPVPASNTAEPVGGPLISTGTANQDVPPGLYTRTDGSAARAGDVTQVVVNLTGPETVLAPLPDAPATAVSETLGGSTPEHYGKWLLILAILLALSDIIATLFVSGRLGSRTGATGLAGALLLFIAVPANDAFGQQRDPLPEGALASTAETTLGYIVTDDQRTDYKSERGMIGLGNALTAKTAIEPGPPVGVTPGEDDLTFFAVLYWPLTENTVPGREALDALSEYLRTGGLLIIDTQNGSSGFGRASAGTMRAIARALNLPPLAPVDGDHVLTRTFYLLNTFPGRWRGERIWAEAAPPRPDGTPEEINVPQFDRIDDNVSPVIVGSADWAAAWATDEKGFPLFPIGRPGDRQRELAIRFGINAVMYALTGNYKSDQVHAPAVLQRLGQ